MRPPAQVLSELFDALAVLMAEANPACQDAHNTEIAKVKEQITQAKTDLAVRPSFTPAMSHQTKKPNLYISYKMAGLGAVPTATVFWTPLICPTELEYSWPAHKQRFILRPLRQ